MSGDPIIDPRNGEQIIREAQALRAVYTPEWTANSGDSGENLLSIFARLMEIMISRLNRTSEKNFLAFLDTAGVRLLPPKTARTPIKFVAAAGAKKDGKVPMGTQVATAAQAGQEPVIFETEEDLTVSRVSLRYLFAHDPAADRYTDLNTIVAANEKNEKAQFQPFAGTGLIPHRLYLAQDTVFQISHRTKITLVFTLGKISPAIDELFQNGLAWKVQSNGEKEIIPDVIPYPKDGTITVILDDPFLMQIDKTTVGGLKSFWVIAETKSALGLNISESTIQSVSITSESTGIKPAAAFFNTTRLDVEREFHPFGEMPKTFDTFFLAVPETFSKNGSTVTLTFTYEMGTGHDIALAFEFWNGTAWFALSTKDDGFKDNTEAFTAQCEPTGKTIEFTCPSVKQVEVNGKTDYWLRARITKGNYGDKASMALKYPDKPPQNPTLADYVYKPENYQPPIITSLTASYSYLKGQEQAATACLAENNFRLSTIDPGKPFWPFETSGERQSACYFGFDSSFSADAVSTYIAVEENVFAIVPRIVWEYWDGIRWKNLGVQDGTTNFTEPGIVKFIGPTDCLKTILFANEAFWLRARLEQGNKAVIRLSGIYLNTVWAGNTITIANELIGSSTETPGESFTLSRTPVLYGVMIEVREPEQPSNEELKTLFSEEGNDAVSSVHEDEGATRECWVRWHRVDHFLASGKKSRHYIMDWSSGVVCFGDGVRGMIPPAGKSSIRAKWYQSGGGARGNAPLNTVNVLKRAIPSIDRAFNVDQAGGGSDGETIDHVKLRGPQALKTRDRAVTWEDYEWLARDASFQVARARCLQAMSKGDAGKVKLILVPWSDDPKPFPSEGLIRQVSDYISSRQRRIATANLTIIGPKYVEISIAANVIPARLEEADLVRTRVKKALTEFFHPLRGGPDRNGWEFGRSVFISEVCKVIEDIEGVDHAEGVEICSCFYDSGEAAVTMPPDHELTRLIYQADIGDGYLVASGDHRIAINGVSETGMAEVFLGNIGNKELHNLRNEQVSCRISEIKSAGHARPFSCLGGAIRAGYDFCAYCFGRSNSLR